MSESANPTRDIEYQPNCHRIERDGEVVARYITTSYGEIKWSVVYANAGKDAVGDMIRKTLARQPLPREEETQCPRPTPNAVFHAVGAAPFPITATTATDAKSAMTLRRRSPRSRPRATSAQG